MKRDGASVQVTSLDCGVDRQLRWIWFLPYQDYPGRLVTVPSLIPDLEEYMRYWRGTLRRTQHQAALLSDNLPPVSYER